jgi:hypothetical protein
MEVSGQIHDTVALPPGRERPWCPLDRKGRKNENRRQQEMKEERKMRERKKQITKQK